MATTFESIFSVFEQTEFFDVDVANFTPDHRSFYYSILLERARGRFRDDAYPSAGFTTNKMEDVVESYNQRYEFTSSSSGTFTATLDPTPQAGASFFASVNGVDFTDNFTYDDSNDEITITGITTTTNDIIVVAYASGQFNQTLNITEVDIVVAIMGYYFFIDKVRNDSLYDIQISGADYNVPNQANLIRSLQSSHNVTRNDIRAMINRYSFKQSPDSLEGLGG